MPRQNQEKSMTRTLTVLAAGSAVALASLAAPTTADARCWGCGVGAGVVAGVAAGAIIAGAASNGYYGPGYAYDPGYAPGYAYAPAPAYGGPAYYGGYGYRRPTSDYTHMDRDLVGTR
jgi:hypothetical protein